MRSRLSAVAAILAGVAVVVSLVDDAQEALAFFAVAMVLATLQTRAAREPFVGVRRRLAMGIAVTWLVAAAWIGVLLVVYQAASRPPPEPEATYLGLTATAYHLVALYGGAVLVSLSAFLPPGFSARRREAV